ncbi:hypothetical protein [Polaromonas eurypsychrophila]|uniref:Uncharacterized protein n=1 Tax=Polaromonas eurypsychrophila TaxID=1614635 RepID=A0A916WMV0_9BURK|nr:hypothetical protein [Polaromonas eurypsychrophila]GGB13331.1 hypothetical protein GCM10011496_37800 [Polaromonas eurypsychrophila]
MHTSLLPRRRLLTAAVTADAHLRGQMWQRGAEIRYLPAKRLATMVQGDSRRWAVIAKATGARAE